MITAELVKSLFVYDEATGIFTRRVNAGKRWKAGQVAGSRTGQGYIEIKIHGRSYQAHRLAWLYMHGELPNKHIDHVNRNTEDNRIANLRLATKSENGANRVALSNNKFGVKGCYLVRGKWRAQCRVNRKLHHLGYFEDVDAARAAYTAFAEKQFGAYHVAA